MRSCLGNPIVIEVKVIFSCTSTRASLLNDAENSKCHHLLTCSYFVCQIYYIYGKRHNVRSTFLQTTYKIMHFSWFKNITDIRRHQYKKLYRVSILYNMAILWNPLFSCLEFPDCRTTENVIPSRSHSWTQFIGVYKKKYSGATCIHSQCLKIIYFVFEALNSMSCVN